MINSKAIIKGGSIYIQDLDVTISKNELLEISIDNFNNSKQKVLTL